jgi:hypothetical protein
MGSWLAQSVQGLDYDLYDQGSFPNRGRDSFLRHRVQTGFGAHPASDQMGTGGSFPGGKTARAWSWLPTSI